MIKVANQGGNNPNYDHRKNEDEGEGHVSRSMSGFDFGSTEMREREMNVMVSALTRVVSGNVSSESDHRNWVSGQNFGSGNKRGREERDYSGNYTALANVTRVDQPDHGSASLGFFAPGKFHVFIK